MTKASPDALADLHAQVARVLAAQLAGAEPDPRILANAIKFLKDNGITSALTPDSPLGNLVESMPFDTD